MSAGERGYGLALASSTAEMPFGMCHYISRVDSGGEAENAGVVVGNRIIEVEGTPVKGSTHIDLIAAIKKYSAMNLPLKMTLAPANELVKLCLAGKIKDGDLFVRDNRRDVTGVNAKDFKVWRMGQMCYVQDWEGGSLPVTIIEVRRGQVGKVDVKVVDTSEVRTVLFTDLQLTPTAGKPESEEGGASEGGESDGAAAAASSDDESSADDGGVGKRSLRERFDSMSGLGVEPGFGSDDDEHPTTKTALSSAKEASSPTLPSAQPANSSPRGNVEWRNVGDKCWALYEEDDKYYSAIIKEIHKDSGTVDVEFDEYPDATYTISAFNLADGGEWDDDGEPIDGQNPAAPPELSDEKGNFGF